MSRTRRLIDLLNRRYPGQNKEKLLAQILCGEVQVNEHIVRDPKQHFDESTTITLNPPRTYVSRGGGKLQAVLQQWRVDVRGLTFIDAGASSGGFTDCLLQYGAGCVYAVDVGYNQLDYRLRKDMRVVVCERTNVMSLSSQDFPFPPDAAVVDLSFRSIRKAAVHLLNLVDPGWLIALIKPQYEWQNPDIRFSGVVHAVDLQGILEVLIIDLNSEGAFVSNMMLSPIRGRKGNREIFFLLSLKQTLDQKQLQRMLKMTLQTGNESGGKGIP